MSISNRNNNLYFGIHSYRWWSVLCLSSFLSFIPFFYIESKNEHDIRMMRERYQRKRIIVDVMVWRQENVFFMPGEISSNITVWWKAITKVFWLIDISPKKNPQPVIIYWKQRDLIKIHLLFIWPYHTDTCWMNWQIFK